MPSIIHRIGMKAPIEKVYAALSTAEGIAAWWTKETSGNSQVGESLEMKFRTPEGTVMGGFEMQVVALDKNKSVQWKVKQGPPDWIGTDLHFNLKKEGDFVILQFAHKNWQESTESMAHCSMKWATFLLSLRELVETGKGKPSPEDLKIDNWN